MLLVGASLIVRQTDGGSANESTVGDYVDDMMVPSH